MDDESIRPAVIAFILAAGVLVLATTAFVFFAHSDGDDGGASPVPLKATNPMTVVPAAPSPSTKPLGATLFGYHPPCLEPDSCRQPSSDLFQDYADSRACDVPGKRVCILPVGGVPKDLLDHLVAYYRAQYNLEVRVIRPVALLPGFDPARPGQLKRNGIRSVMSQAYPAYSDDSDVVFIGLTPIDVYCPERPSWNWCFGSTFSPPNQDIENSAVLSIFRMDPVAYRLPRNDDLRNTRVRKMMNKYIAIMYYGIPRTSDPNSVTYDSIGGVGDLDRMSERIPLSR